MSASQVLTPCTLRHGIPTLVSGRVCTVAESSWQSAAGSAIMVAATISVVA